MPARISYVLPVLPVRAPHLCIIISGIELECVGGMAKACELRWGDSQCSKPDDREGHNLYLVCPLLYLAPTTN